MSNIELLHIYVLKNQFQLIKIGIASNVGKRIKNIQTNSGVPIIQHYESPSCANATQIEKAVHEHFAEHRKLGEWFDISFDDAVDYVKGHFVDTTQQLVLPVDELNREFNGVKIRQRTSDNYLDATAMCQANGKLFADYERLKTTQEFLGELSSVMGIPITEQNQILIKVIQGGKPQNQGTWVHPQVSINLAQWCSPKFAVLVTEWIFELMTKGYVSLNAKPTLNNPELEAYITARVRDEVRNALAKPVISPKPPPKPDYPVYDSRYQVRQAIANGAETLKEVGKITGISYDALKKLVRRMAKDGEIERIKIGNVFKLSLTNKAFSH